MRQKGLDFGDPEAAAPRALRRRALTVSELTERIQGLLESEIADVWVEGEVSNLKLAASGHWYFTLKDDEAQLRAVVWRNDARLIRFRPRDGMKVLARGGLRVYPPRGEYQLCAQLLEPLGKGSLQQAFEELKAKLEREGLFAAERKRPLPMLPRRIGVISSPGGAVIRDILRVLRTRYANIELLLYPARVQGDEAVAELVQGLRVLNRLGGLDVIVLARGGGSLEDLQAFNDERVARAIAASSLPTISAIGHETDFTIADFVADLRAPTPSAAAERVVDAKEDLAARILALERRRDGALRLRLERAAARLSALAATRVFAAERRRIQNAAQRVDDVLRRGETGLARRVERAEGQLRRVADRLDAFRLDRRIGDWRARLLHAEGRLVAASRGTQERRRAHLRRLVSMLDGLSPLAVLGRGFALVWDEAGARLLRDSTDVEPGRRVRIRLHRGALRAIVDSRETE